MTKGAQHLIAVCLGLPLACASLCLAGVVFSDMWRWFAMPLFSDLPAITWKQAIGLIVLLEFFFDRATVRLPKTKADDEDAIISNAVQQPITFVVLSLIVWANAAAWHAWVLS